MNILDLYFLPFYVESTLLKNILIKFYRLINFYFEKSIMIIFCTIIVFQINIFYLYHLVKKQEVVKLYVLYNILELFERMVYTVIEDLMNVDVSNEYYPGMVDSEVDFNPEFCNNYGKNYRNNKFLNLESDESIEFNSINNSKRQIKSTKKSKIHIKILLFIFNTLQAIILNTEFVVIHLSMKNFSDLFGLLICNQFLDLKGTIFKKVDNESINDILEMDLKKRFDLILFVILVIIANLREMEVFEIKYVLYPLSVLVFKIVTDWIKHIFLCRYNNVNLKVYKKFKGLVDYSVGYNIVILGFISVMIRGY